MISESDQHGLRRAIFLLRTTPFEKGLITVINKGKLLLVFIVPAAAVAYRYFTNTSPPSFLAIGFLAVPIGCKSVNFQSIRVSPLRPLIMRSLSKEETGPQGEA